MHAGKLVGMFRNPEQRILSGYRDDFNNFAAVNYAGHLQQILAMYANGTLDMERCTDSLRGLPKVPLLEFAEGWKGGMTYQLVVEHPTAQTLDLERPQMTLQDAEDPLVLSRESGN